jgi:type IV pilus assembly protein PilE
MMSRNAARGFTLIELMVVVAIVAIIVAIALPSYQEQVRKSRRADAARAVGQMQLDFERWRAENPSYADCTGVGCGSGKYPSAPSSDFYTTTPSGATATEYIITAAPTGVQAGDRCGNLVAKRSVNNGKPAWANADCN